VFDASVGVGDTLFGGAGFWGGAGVAAAPLSVAAPLVAVPSGAGATDIAAAASSKVAAGGAWSGEWSGDAWTGSAPSDAWLGTGDAAGATGASGSDASFADFGARLQLAVQSLRSMRCRSVSFLSCAGPQPAFEPILLRTRWGLLVPYPTLASALRGAAVNA